MEAFADVLAALIPAVLTRSNSWPDNSRRVSIPEIGLRTLEVPTVAAQRPFGVAL